MSPSSIVSSGRAAARSRTLTHRTRAVALFAAIAAGLAGCSIAPAEPGEPAQPESAGGQASPGHIHGLSIEDSETVVVATHNGLFRWEADSDDVTGPIADNTQDTMGFSAIDGVYFGSGHPGADSPAGLPDPLGFIMSTDEGLNWKTVSLSGETDFHDIAPVRDATGGYDIYAYDAAQRAIRFSDDDGISWVTGSTINARDITVDQATGAVCATTEAGVQCSVDDGLTFTPQSDAPSLYLIEGLDDGSGRMVGVDLDGAVWVRVGGEWSIRGSVVGAVEALAVGGESGETLVVADDRGVTLSYDLGATWAGSTTLGQ